MLNQCLMMSLTVSWPWPSRRPLLQRALIVEFCIGTCQGCQGTSTLTLVIFVQRITQEASRAEQGGSPSLQGRKSPCPQRQARTVQESYSNSCLLCPSHTIQVMHTGGGSLDAFAQNTFQARKIAHDQAASGLSPHRRPDCAVHNPGSPGGLPWSGITTGGGKAEGSVCALFCKVVDA